MKITKKQLKNIVEQAMRPAGRPIYEIAEEIYQAWPKVNPHAQPYLDAMQSLETVNDKYGMEDGASIVEYFLVNAGSFRGPEAKRIKSELRKMTKGFWK